MKLCKAFYKILLIPVVALALVACGGSGSGTNTAIDGIDGPSVEVVNGNVVMSIVFKNVSIDAGATIPIPKYTNSSLQIGPDFQSNGTLLTLVISAADYLGNLGNGFDPQSLPGGRPLPGVASGSLPSVAFQIPQLANTTLYVGPEVFGFFVPVSGLDFGGAILTFRFYDKAGLPVGNLSAVGADAAGKNSGALLLLSPSLLGIKGTAEQIKAYKLYSKIYQ